MHKGPRNVLNGLQSGPWTKGRRSREGGRPNSGEVARRRRGPEGQGPSGGRGTPEGWLGCDAGWLEEVDGDEQNAAAEAHGEGPTTFILYKFSLDQRILKYFEKFERT